MPRAQLFNKLMASLLVVAAGVVGVYFAARAGGAGAGVLATIALACAVALVARVEPASSEALSLSLVFDGVLLALPGALVVYFSFDSGGYFPASPAFAAILLIVVLILRVTLVDEPFIAFSRPLAIAAGALGLFALWTLLSAVWSDAPARSLIEFDRTFAYLLLVILIGSVARTARRLRFMAAGVALAIVAVAVAALATRLMPDRFPVDTPTIGAASLTYPLTYANALGILCSLGGILALYFTTSARQPRLARALGAAALPILAATVYLTLSRGPVAGAVIGIVAFLVLGRPRGLLTGLIAAGPASVIAVVSAYRHEALTSSTPTSPLAVDQGHEVAMVVALCTVGAFVVRMVVSPLDARLADFHLPERSHRPVVAGAWAAGILAVVVIGLALDGPRRISDQYHRFVETAEASPEQKIRPNIFDPSNRGLIDNWRISRDAFKDHPLGGTGAGTYEVVWNENRPAKQSSYNVTDGHSLYLEVLGELGLVGFLLLVTFVAMLLIGQLPYRRGPNTSLYAALFGMTLAWATHAGVDWDWEMPAVTAGVFALGAAALATHEQDLMPSFAHQSVRVAASLVLLVSAIAPGLVLASQRTLNESLDALRRGDCTEAVLRASDSISTLEIRPEPYEVQGLCQIRKARPAFAVQAFKRAAERDPDNWRYHYELATAQGNAGIDPRPELRTAQRLNPHNPELNSLISTIPPGQSAAWDIELIGPGGATGAALP
jgi:O-antigen ligase